MPLADEYLDEIEKVEKRPLRNIPFLREQGEIAGAAARGTINAIPVHNRQLERYYAPRDTRGDYAPPDVEGITVTAPPRAERQAARRERERRERENAFRRLGAGASAVGRGAADAAGGLHDMILAGMRNRMMTGAPVSPAGALTDIPGASDVAAELTMLPAVGRSYAATREAVRSDDPERAEHEGAGLVGNTAMAGLMMAPELAALRNLRLAGQGVRTPRVAPAVSRGEFRWRPMEEATPMRRARSVSLADEGAQLDRMNLGEIWDRTKRRMAAATDTDWTLRYAPDINRWELSGPTGRRTFEMRGDADQYMLRNNIAAREIKPNTGNDLSDWVAERRASRNQLTGLQREHDEQLTARGVSPATMGDVIEGGRQPSMFPGSTPFDDRLGAAGVGKIGESVPLLGAAGLTAGGLAAGAGDAQAQESQPIEAARSRVAELEAIERTLSSGSVLDKQNALIEMGYNVRPDGRMGAQTEGYIAQARRRNDQALEEARGGLEELVGQEASRATRAGPGIQAARDLAPLAALPLGVVLGLLTRRGAVQHATQQLTARNVQADALLAPVRGRNAAATRMGRINEFWRAGGAGERVPFTRAQTQRGFKSRSDAATGSELFPPGPERLRGGDIATLGTAGGEAGVSFVMLQRAERELEDAQADLKNDKSEANYARVEAARNQVAIWESTMRAGLAFGASRAGAAYKMPYANVRPNVARAERERAALDQLLAPRRRAPRGGKK